MFHLVRVGVEHLLQFIIIELGVRIGNAHEEPGQAGELVAGDVLHEHAAQVGTIGCNACAGGHHDVHRIGVARQQQDLARRACEQEKANYHLIGTLAGLSILLPMESMNAPVMVISSPGLASQLQCTLHSQLMSYLPCRTEITRCSRAQEI